MESRVKAVAVSNSFAAEISLDFVGPEVPNLTYDALIYL